MGHDTGGSRTGTAGGYDETLAQQAILADAAIFDATILARSVCFQALLDGCCPLLALMR